MLGLLDSLPRLENAGKMSSEEQVFIPVKALKNYSQSSTEYSSSMSGT
jgi:hypothetical protein